MNWQLEYLYANAAINCFAFKNEESYTLYIMHKIKLLLLFYYIGHELIHSSIRYKQSTLTKYKQ